MFSRYSDFHLPLFLLMSNIGQENDQRSAFLIHLDTWQLPMHIEKKYHLSQKVADLVLYGTQILCFIHTMFWLEHLSCRKHSSKFISRSIDRKSISSSINVKFTYISSFLQIWKVQTKHLSGAHATHFYLLKHMVKNLVKFNTTTKKKVHLFIWL